jgi:hypothetical protein
MHRQACMAVILAALSLAACGCGAGLFAYDAVGPGQVPAKWVPPKEATLVLVENDRAAPGLDADCDRLGRFISDDLKTNKVAPLVDADPLVQMRERDSAAYDKMSIAALGRAVGAKQVIYVSVQEYGPDNPMGAGNDSIKWSADVRVRVVDSQSGASRWPQDLTDGLPVKAETEYKAKYGTASDITMRDDLNQKLAEKIGKLFHSYEPETETEEDYQQ